MSLSNPPVTLHGMRQPSIWAEILYVLREGLREWWGKLWKR